MFTKPRPAHTLLNGIALAACMGLPAAAASQTAPPASETVSLSAAMAEARLSAFHTSTPVERFTSVAPGGIPVRRVGDQPTADLAVGPSVQRVFWPTLGATFLSQAAFLLSFLHCDPDSGGGCGKGEELGSLLLGSTALVLGPPTAASLGGGSFTKGLLGSAAGLAAGWVLFHSGRQMGLDDSTAVWALPAAHALLTTSFSIGR